MKMGMHLKTTPTMYLMLAMTLVAMMLVVMMLVATMEEVTAGVETAVAMVVVAIETQTHCFTYRKDIMNYLTSLLHLKFLHSSSEKKILHKVCDY